MVQIVREPHDEDGIWIGFGAVELKGESSSARESFHGGWAVVVSWWITETNDVEETP